jgi:hypothetical protein
MIAKSKSSLKYPVGNPNISYIPVVATAVDIIGDKKETDPVPTPEIIVLFGIRGLSSRKYGVMTHVDPLSTKPAQVWLLLDFKALQDFNKLSR